MILCNSQTIFDSDIQRAIDWMRAADQTAKITPAKVNQAFRKKPE